MAQKVADPCRNCGAVLGPGAAFCTLCGATVTNRAASSAPSSVPLGGPHSNPFATGGNPSGFVGGTSGGAVRSGAASVPAVTAVSAPGGQAGWPADGAGGRSTHSLVQTIPGIIPVGTSTTAPLVAPQEVGVDPRIAAATALVPGGAGRRLSAKIIDSILPGILLGVATIFGAMNIEVTQVGEFNQLNLTWMLVAVGIASLLSLGYGVWLWLWEAKSGKTLGNLAVGLRTTNMDGGPAGLLAIFLRHLIISVSNIIPTIGPLLVIVSNAWDAHGKRQGWHDKVARTLVFNVKAGRDPLETGGLAERESFAPASVPTISPVRSPLTAHAQNQAQAQAPGGSTTGGFAPPAVHFQNQPAQPQQSQAEPAGGTPEQNQPGHQGSPFAPPFTPASHIPVDSGPITSVPGFSREVRPEPLQQQSPQQQASQHQRHAQPGVVPEPLNPSSTHASSMGAAGHGAPVPAPHADDDAGETRVRPVTQNAALRLSFDDGRSEDVSAVALIGRNPAGYDGEMIHRLISVQDSSRSVSKTHLHLRVSAEGLWVTDRNSTNGSGITRPAGGRTALAGGTPALAEIGATVDFGDRSFVIGRA